MSRKKWNFVQKIELRSEKWLCHLQFLCKCTSFALVSGASAAGVSLLQDARSTPCSCIALARAKLVCFLNLCVEGADHTRPVYPLGHCRGYFVHLCASYACRVCVGTKPTTLRASVHTKTQVQYVLSRVLSTYFEAAVLEYLLTVFVSECFKEHANMQECVSKC